MTSALLTTITRPDGANYVRGDRFHHRPTITVIPTSALITSAKFTLKQWKHAAAIITKAITTTPVADVGEIEDDNTDADGIGIVRFEFTPAETLALIAGFRYQFDVEIVLTGGANQTVQMGTFTLDEHVTT